MSSETVPNPMGAPPGTQGDWQAPFKKALSGTRKRLTLLLPRGIRASRVAQQGKAR
jgi:hypothetical protein